MASRRLQVYQTSQVRVTYDPDICRDSGVCLRTLSAVFDTDRTPWIRPEEATPDEVIAAVRKCPSGALHAQLVTTVFRSREPGREE